MAMLRTCRADGCTTKTLGELCIDHEAEPTPEPGPAEPRDAQASRQIRASVQSATLAAVGSEPDDQR